MATAIKASEASPSTGSEGGRKPGKGRQGEGWSHGAMDGEGERTRIGQCREGVDGDRRPLPTRDARGLEYKQRSGGSGKQDVSRTGKRYGPRAARCDAFARSKKTKLPDDS
ncbi:hypothetical protein E2C01_064469 [Portunus trituberculatus]|uniref:Uncharacterized protein n=1 Tax=Portunus trituberculatus TaxID=210409 RepID=A0A5B7HLW1_PORTR|nr:hypothetical protein [Portunus trituberculatus]